MRSEFWDITIIRLKGKLALKAAGGGLSHLIDSQEVLPCKAGDGIMVLQMDLKDLEQELAEYAVERVAVLLPDEIPKEDDRRAYGASAGG